jgi:hypothetical protein
VELKLLNGPEANASSLEERRYRQMAKNAPKGDGHRIGAVRDRTQFQHPNGHWVKRDADTGRIKDVKSDGRPFKGVTKE